MKKISLLIVIYLTAVNSFGQMDELEHFRNELTLFIDHDQKEADSPDQPETVQLKENVEEAFRLFVLHKDSKDLDHLKKEAESGNYSYSFSNLRRDRMVKSMENNEDYMISFYGMYDYQLSNFVSVYIQPFVLNKERYCVYYYKINGAGKYYVKEIARNKIVFTSEGLTSNAAVINLHTIDKKHFLIIEDMGDAGQRALVVQTDKKGWKAIEGFKGNSWIDKSEKKFEESRKYLRLVSNKTINNHQSYGYLKQNGIRFYEELKTISYPISADNLSFNEAKWDGKSFTIDDYYLGTHLPDGAVPFPD